MAEDKPMDVKQVQVHTPEHLRAGVYANFTNASITENELILNFIFSNESDSPNGTLVSRVIVSRRHATALLKLLHDAISTAEEVDPQK